MAQFTNNFQNFGYGIPADGEIFVNKNDDYWKESIYKRVGNKIIQFNLSEFAMREDPNQSKNRMRSHFGGGIIKSQYGIDYDKLPGYTGEGIQYFIQKGGIKNITDISQFKDTSTDFTRSETITAGLDPTNPHRLLTVSSLSGKTPPPPAPAGALAALTAQTPGGQARAKEAGQPISTPTPAPPQFSSDKYEFSKQMAAMPPQQEADKPIKQIGNVSQFPNFERQLQFGSTGEDVKQLQKFLNEAGFLVGKDGEAGSIGNETTYFGPSTQKALQEFQKSQGIVSKGDPQSTGYGRFGPKTLKSVNSLIDTTTGQDKLYTPITSQTLAKEDTGAKTGIVDKITPEIIQQIKDTETEEDLSLEEMLSNSTASEDEKDIIRSMFSSISSFDTDLMERLEAGLDAAEKLQEPYFSAQIRLAKDELARGFTKFEDDLAFQEESLTRNLSQLKEDITIAKERGSIEEQSQLAQLEKALTLKLGETRQNLATTGFTSSTRRARSEELLQESAGELRESKTRGFAQRREDLTTSLARGETDTQAELKRLKDLTSKGKVDLGRRAEEFLGSKEASGLGFNLLGDISGTLTKQRQEDTRKFAGSFIF